MKTLFLVLFSCCLTFSQAWAAPFSDAEANFQFALKKLLEQHVDSHLTKEQLYQAATAGMLQSLNDAEQDWNKLLTPEDLAALQNDLTGKISGIGVVIKVLEETGTVRVIGLVKNSAAEKAGIKTDDQIISIDGQKLKGKTLPDVAQSIRGKVGTKVTLKVLRDDKVISFQVPRQVVSWVPVEWQKVAPGTALLTLSYFTNDSPQQVETALREINEAGLKNLIIDLRRNTGGSFEKALGVSELFLAKNTLIAQAQKRDGKVEKFTAHGKEVIPGLKLTVLIDKTTSSGAEMFAACLKENRQARLVGKSTFGKWTAQSVEVLPNQYAMKYTIQNFQSPQGHSYQGTGLKPDIEIPFPTGFDPGEWTKASDTTKRLAVDSQLRTAVELMQTL